MTSSLKTVIFITALLALAACEHHRHGEVDYRHRHWNDGSNDSSRPPPDRGSIPYLP
ncbi:hypothetical protein [Acetobacter conturbans]|uniref:Lipoprotein n=1 Tax=Acetobacter conturbans TaxID=1737472 RepID=A0ABX0JYK1_9PROT|nr:hypothetical protein [Acetobacter conturbans]NHN87123.1 hypothetical protein [Acetobacter conturbans]